MNMQSKTDEIGTAMETINLTKNYGHKVALDHLNLKVSKGTIHGIIGPNGAGKTTLLKMLCGVTNPTSGCMYILGLDVEAEPEKTKAQIGYIPENPMAYETLTVNELLDFVGELYQVTSEKLKMKKHQYLELFKMEAYKDEYVGSLSKGLLQRAIICFTMLREPQVFLLDEPFYGLDPFGAWQFKQLLKENRGNRKTILLCTHMLSIVEELCDYVTIINDGKKVAEGSVQDLRSINRSTDRKPNSDLEEVFLSLTEENIET
jgi:ABC-2 type transport system ATP-binding protein